MEQVEIIGILPYSFKNEEGQQLHGYTYHVAFLSPTSRVGGQGREVKTYSVTQAVYDSWPLSKKYVPEVGDHVTVVFNRYGKINYFMELA